MPAADERWPNFGDNAPITEALIDIQVVTPPDLEVDELRDFAKPWPDRFSRVELQTQLGAQIRVGFGDPAPTVTASHAVRGFLFANAGGRVVQARRDGFTFSQLRPYESWAALRREAAEHWERYVEVTRPQKVRRLAVRCVNHFSLPDAVFDLRELFHLHPTVPDALGPMDEFILRLVVRHPENPDYRAITTQATGPDPEGRPAIVLDIDVFVGTDLVPGSDRIWPMLDDLHEFRNRVFFDTITPKTAERLT